MRAEYRKLLSLFIQLIHITGYLRNNNMLLTKFIIAEFHYDNNEKFCENISNAAYKRNCSIDNLILTICDRNIDFARL